MLNELEYLKTPSQLSSYAYIHVLLYLYTQTSINVLFHEYFLKSEKIKNKAGYTANTSCGRVGRGGNARFHTLQLDHHGRTNGPTDQRTDGPTDGQSLL